MTRAFDGEKDIIVVVHETRFLQQSAERNINGLTALLVPRPDYCGTTLSQETREIDVDFEKHAVWFAGIPQVCLLSVNPATLVLCIRLIVLLGTGQLAL